MRDFRTDDESLVQDASGYTSLPQLDLSNFKPMLNASGSPIISGGAVSRVEVGDLTIEGSERRVVIKYDHGTFLKDNGDLTPIEATVLSHLKHPHIVQIFGRTMINGKRAIVTEFVPYKLYEMTPSRANYASALAQLSSVMDQAWRVGFTLRDFSRDGDKDDRVRLRNKTDGEINIAVVDWNATGYARYPEQIAKDWIYLQQRVWGWLVEVGGNAMFPKELYDRFRRQQLVSIRPDQIPSDVPETLRGVIMSAFTLNSGFKPTDLVKELRGYEPVLLDRVPFIHYNLTTTPEAREAMIHESLLIHSLKTDLGFKDHFPAERIIKGILSTYDLSIIETLFRIDGKEYNAFENRNVTLGERLIILRDFIERNKTSYSEETLGFLEFVYSYTEIRSFLGSLSFGDLLKSKDFSSTLIDGIAISSVREEYTKKCKLGMPFELLPAFQNNIIDRIEALVNEYSSKNPYAILPQDKQRITEILEKMRANAKRYSRPYSAHQSYSFGNTSSAPFIKTQNVIVVEPIVTQDLPIQLETLKDVSIEVSTETQELKAVVESKDREILELRTQIAQLEEIIKRKAEENKLLEERIKSIKDKAKEIDYI